MGILDGIPERMNHTDYELNRELFGEYKEKWVTALRDTRDHKALLEKVKTEERRLTWLYRERGKTKFKTEFGVPRSQMTKTRFVFE